MNHIVKILSEREKRQHVEYEQTFTCIGDENDGCGFGFPCEKDGTLIHNESYDCWIKNYESCLAHPERFEAEGVKKISWWYTEPAHALCSCGEEILLQGDTECPNCGQLYNAFGQPLVDPEYWEEDYEYQMKQQFSEIGGWVCTDSMKIHMSWNGSQKI